MKHLFIVNPAAGKKDQTDYVREQCARVFSGRCGDYEVYVTKAPRDAEGVIRQKAGGCDDLRVYACGGDGTLHECANGAAFLPNVTVTHFPCGTGNDFIKTFGADRALFLELENLVDGFVRPLDLISVNDRYGLNVCSVGTDARIGANVHKYSKIPLIGGATGYVVSMAVEFLRGISRPMDIVCGGRTFSGGITLACICNGRFYGGGFNPEPGAIPDDGVLEFIVVPKVSRLTFVRLVGDYAKGKAYRHPKEIIRLRGERLSAEAEEDFVVNLDGEIVTLRQVEFAVRPGALRFLFPKGCTFFTDIRANSPEFCAE